MTFDPPPLTFLKDQQADAGGPAHDVRGVLGIAGEGAIIAELQVLDQDRAIAPTRVPHKLHPVPEGPLVVHIGNAASVVEDLQRTRTPALLP